MYTGKFLRIPFDFFNNTDNYNLFTQVNTKGFFLYSYLLYRQTNSSSCEVSLKMIQTFLNREYDKRPLWSMEQRKSIKLSYLKKKIR